MGTRTTEAPVVVLDDVTKRYGQVLALDHVDLEIGRGKLVALLGPNGAGKTTMIDILLGLRHAGSGEARVLAGSPQRAVTAGRVGAMLQRGGLPDGARVGEVLKLVSVLYGRVRAADELASFTGMSALIRRPVARLSGGEAQRLRFALALAGDPELLFLDEPTVALDVEARSDFWAAVGEVAAGGTTVLFATHYLEEAGDHAGRIVVVDRGRVAADGPPSDITSRAATRTVRCVPSTANPARLSALPGVAEVSVHGREIELRCTDADAAVKALVASDGEVREMRVLGADLADALRSLTGA